MKLIFALLTVFSVSAVADECPVRAGETTLTISRVMYNFRDYLDAPDRTIAMGLSQPENISDAEMASNISDLNVALACADVVLRKDSADLIPERYSELQGAAQVKYLEDFYTWMSSFREALATYLELYQAQAVANPRDFNALYLQHLTVRSIANEAHHKL